MKMLSCVRPNLLAAASFVIITAARVSTAQPAVIYANDFKSRISANPIDIGTYLLPYHTGRLVNIDATSPYNDQTGIQDGWVKGKNNGAAHILIKNDGGNPFVSLCHTNYGQFGYALQPIVNSLTGGVVRFSADMRPPRQWSGSTRCMLAYIGPDAFFTYAAQEFYNYPCCVFGIASSNALSDTDFKFRAFQGNGAGGGTVVYGTAEVDTTHWYRFIAEMDLSDSSYTLKVYDLGTAQPTLATLAQGTPAEAFGGTAFRFQRDLSPALGGITTLGLSAHGPRGGNDGAEDIDLTARFDNIAIAVKPDGGSSFTEAYANDFSTRTFTRLGSGATAYTYTLGSADSGGTLTYARGNLTPTATLEFPHGANGPIGQDGWARRNSGVAPFVITTNSSGNQYLCAYIPNGNNYGYAVQRFGNCLTNGALRFSIDMRPPNAWYWTYRGMEVYLGDDAFYLGEKYNPDPSLNSFMNHNAATFGFNGLNSSDIRFAFYDGNGANSTVLKWGTATVTTTNWYRFVADLNLNQNTLILNIYDLGGAHPASATATPGAPVQTFTGGFRRNIGTALDSLGGITAIGLTVFGVRGGDSGTNAPAETARFDNITLKATPSGFTEPIPVYANDFTSRTYTNLAANATDVARLTGNIDMLSGGQDEWMLRNVGRLYSYLSGSGGNPHLRFSYTGADHSYSVQPLGTRVTQNVLCCQVDIRPPCYWNWSYHGIGVWLSDDEFWQGNRNATRCFNDRWAVQFGFGSASAGVNSFGVYPDVSFLATDGDGTGVYSNRFAGGVVTANWYRFKAEVNLAANTYTVKVFNLGTAHPVPQSPTPDEPVALFENLRFKKNMRSQGDTDDKLDGISCFGLVAFGVRGGALFPASEAALVDNLLFAVKRRGTIFFLQ